MTRISLFLASLAVAASARAWDTNAHKVIGVIAYRHLTPQAKAWADGLLKTLPNGFQDFLDAAPYPDYLKHGGPKDKPVVKRSRKYDGWHFIDYPVKEGQTLAFPTDESVEQNGNNALFGIAESVRQVTRGPEATRGLYLSLLLHIIGDVHQPLHCAERADDKGGNAVALRGAIRNLHAYWDDAITVKYKLKGKSRGVSRATDARIEEVATSVESEFPLAKFGEEIAAKDPKAWAEESYALAVDSAYDGLTPRTKPDAAYANRWTIVAEGRVALAGYRLADFLNRLVAGKVKA